MLSKVLCNLCGSDHYNVLYDTLVPEQEDNHSDSYKITDHSVNCAVRIVKCCKCGLIYINSPVDQSKIVANYTYMVDDFYVQEENGRRESGKSILKYFKKLNKTGKIDRKSTRLNSSHSDRSRMPSSA